MYLKARLGPGPYVYATVFGCISIGVNCVLGLRVIHLLTNIHLAQISVSRQERCSLILITSYVEKKFTKLILNVAYMLPAL